MDKKTLFKRNFRWRKSYGDNQYTEDLVLWFKNKPQHKGPIKRGPGKDDVICISGHRGWYKVFDGPRIIYDAESIKEAKLYVEEELIKNIYGVQL